MPQSYKRKNNAINNAMAGLERGLGQGIAIGQRSRALQQDEDNAAFARQQALRQAQIVDSELRREEQARQAESQAVGELADKNNPWDAVKKGAPGNGAFAGVGPALSTVGLSQQDKRVKTIAQELARRGRLKEAMIFVEESQQKATRQADEDHRSEVMSRISRSMQDGSLFGTNPDGSKIDNENVNKSIKNLTELISNPNVPAVAIELEYNKLLSGAASDQSAFDNKNAFVDNLRQRFAALGEQQVQNGTQTPESSLAQHKQQARVNSLINNASQFYHAMFPAKPTAQSTKIASDFMEQVSLAEQGYAGVINGPADPITGQRMKIPYTFEQESGIQSLMQDFQRAKLEAEQAKAELARIQGETTKKRGLNLDADTRKKEIDAGLAPTDAETERMKAEAELNRSRKTPPEKDAIDYADARKMAASELATDEKYNDAEPDAQIEMIRKRAEQIMDDARTARGQAITDKAVLGSKKGKSQDARDREKYAIEHADELPEMTAEEFDQYIETGELPPKKK